MRYLYSEKDERLTPHSNGDIHYWQEYWFRGCNEVGIGRLLSKKACSLDNSACEGFFDRFKNEFSTYRDWQGAPVEEPIVALV